MTYSYALTQDTHWQSQAHWQVPNTPFMTFAFWQALSDTQAIGGDSGWLPIFIMIYQNNSSTDESSLVAVMPLFVKGHHRGEFVFDHAWAEAFARYGADYYPRLVTSIPYTPITGQRLWLAEGVELSADIFQAALAGVDDIAAQVSASSWHGLFVTGELAKLATSPAMTSHFEPDLMADAPEINESIIEQQLFERQGCQFLWQNRNLMNEDKRFDSFDEFLQTLTAKKRRTIRSERKKVAKQGLECRLKTGDEITEADWAAFYHCYVMTYAIRGQQPYLTAEFFTQLGASLPEHLMLAQALDASGEIIASSLFLYDTVDEKVGSDNATLYGRYWGALGEYDSLHFELCYYQGIEFAIAQGLDYFDPGTQGEHKLIRGFVPTATHSLHRIYDARFVPAIGHFCEQDREHMRQYREQAHEALPFNADNMPAFKG